jgi:hypothetical protein
MMLFLVKMVGPFQVLAETQQLRGWTILHVSCSKEKAMNQTVAGW